MNGILGTSEVQTVNQPEEQDITVFYVLRNAYSMFRKCFREIFSILLLPTAASYVIYIVLARWTSLSFSQPDFLRWEPLTAWYSIGFCVAWLLAAFAFAAVVHCLLHDDPQARPKVVDCYKAALGRMNALFTIAMISYLPTFVTFHLINRFSFVIDPLLHVFDWPSPIRFYVSLLTLAAMQLLFLALIGRIAFAIPEAMKFPDTDITGLISRSLKYKGCEPFFIGLFGSLSILSTGAAGLRDYFLDFSAHQNALNSTMYPWESGVISIIVATILQGILFTTLLALHAVLTAKPEESQAAIAG